MRLHINKSKNAASLYVIKSFRENGKNTTKIVEKLGTMAELSKLHEDPIAWANEYIAELNRQEKAVSRDVLVKYNQSKRIEHGVQNSFSGGYLFLQKVYHELGMPGICKEIGGKYRYDFNLDSVLSRLLYGRILFPASKLGTLKFCQQLLEAPDFELQHIYRGLEVISKESDFIQSQLYKNSLAHSKRNDRILYYDCTNYFFEIEEAKGLKQYGPSKEHRPNPIVEMGLFMDGDGIPLAFSLHSGNTSEQKTLKPLEQQILKDFSLSRFVVCTDAGLSSMENRKFNDQGNRAFITTQSIKKLKDKLKEWAISPQGWSLPSDIKKYDISSLIDEERYSEQTFYKEQWIKESGLEQRLIVTFSIKYRDYQRSIRNAQIERAKKLLESRPDTLKKPRQNDFKRFVKHFEVTPNGELADKTIFEIDSNLILSEQLYDGIYAVCTNLEDDPAVIAKINHRRWEIEESFRIMKTEFKARPVYLSRDDRIKAHFTTCFLSLTLFRYLEKRLNNKFTCTQIVQGLRDMCFLHISGEGYLPTYTRTDFTDALHDAFNFHTDFQILSNKQMKNIFHISKSP